MATAKQIAWRKKFAALSKAGKLPKKKAAARKKNPAKKTTIPRAGVSKTAYVARDSQATRKAPSPRLKARRKLAVKPGKPSGYFPNPVAGRVTKSKLPANFPYVVQFKNPLGNWHSLSAFKDKSAAFQYAKAYAVAYPTLTIRVIHYTGGPMPK